MKFVMKKVDVFLFDLGKVLVELDGPPLKNAWLAEPISEAESWQRWGASHFVKAFESGAITKAEFTAGIKAEQQLLISEEAFEKAFTAWPKRLYPGAAEMLRTLMPNYVLAYYSNTSELHVPRLLNEMGLKNYFHYTFASCEIGYFKPDAAGYEFILNALGVSAERVLFIDDNAHNVAGAKAMGMNAEQAEGFDQVYSVVRRWTTE
jgi:putative hydrolase of the HAD superfamily